MYRLFNSIADLPEEKKVIAAIYVLDAFFKIRQRGKKYYIGFDLKEYENLRHSYRKDPILADKILNEKNWNVCVMNNSTFVHHPHDYDTLEINGIKYLTTEKPRY